MSILLKGGKPSPAGSVDPRLASAAHASHHSKPVSMPPIELDEIPVRIVGPRGEFMGQAAEVGIVIGITLILTALKSG